MSKRTYDEMAAGSQVTGLPPKTAELLVSGMWSDLTIKCGDKLWKAHKVVCCLQSPPFQAAVNGNFQEAQTGIIDLSDHDPEIVNYMVKYMYTGDYAIIRSKTEENEASPNSQISSASPSEHPTIAENSDILDTAPQDLSIHTSVYILAEEKDIPNLKALACKKYKEALPRGWNSVEFCDSLKRIYEGTPESDHMLWDVAVAFAGSKAKELMDRGEFVEMSTENGYIGLAVFKAHLSQCNPPPTVAKPALLRPSGCPDKGVAHAQFIQKGRRTAFYCASCRKPFD